MHLECVFARSRSMSRDQGAVGVEEGFLLLSNKQLVDEELCWQFGSTSSLACSSQYILVEKDPNLEFTAATTRKNRDCGKQADIELEWQWIVHEQESSKCGLLSCPYCKEKKSNDSSNALYHEAVRGTRSTESRSAQLFSSELLAANCAVKGFNHWHVHESGHLCSVVSQNHRQHITRPFSSQGDSITANHSEHDPQELKITHLSSMPSSKCIGDQVLLSERFQSAPQLHVVSSNLQNQQQNSFEDRSISWSKNSNRGNALAKPEKLGAALCHSQTRARNAEKLASEALIEKEKLAKLVFREASTRRMYKKRGHLLELENLWLKTHVKDDSGMGCELPAYFNASDSRHCKFYKKGFSKDSSSVPGTIGLAFALGLSCASAGFVIGCCMGLIGLSH